MTNHILRIVPSGSLGSATGSATSANAVRGFLTGIEIDADVGGVVTVYGSGGAIGTVLTTIPFTAGTPVLYVPQIQAVATTGTVISGVYAYFHFGGELVNASVTSGTVGTVTVTVRTE